MADLRGQQLPNLKISVDNTESTEESDDEVEVEERAEISIQDEDVDESEESVEEREPDKNDVEFNVRIHGIGSFSDLKSKPKEKRGRAEGRRLSDVDKSDSAMVVTESATDDSERPSQILEKRIYENKSGGFITGIDVTSKEAQEKREKRAKRFRIEPSDGEQSSIQALFTSLGIREEDFEDQQRGLRKEALHLRGTDNMSTQDVFDYFAQFPASGIEWINDTSCNIVWLDKVTGIRAMLKLSRSYDDVMAEETKSTERRKEKQNKKEHKQKEKQKPPKDEEMKEEDDAPDTNQTQQADTAQPSTETGPQEEEEMEVDDDDELDLTVDDDAIISKNKKKLGKVSAESDKLEKTVSETSENPDMEKTVANKALVNDGQDGASSKDSEKSVKKKEKREKEKDRGEEGEVSDNGSSSSSSGSSSDSSSGSSSDSSDSSSSSGSDSDGSSGSASENRKKKKSSLKSDRDADTGEIVQTKGQTDQRKKYTIPWPPGKWRLGLPSKKAVHLFMRFATQDDKKAMGAEKQSQYYRKYGNPNYGGMKGLISNSRKRKIRIAKLDKERKSQGPDAREMIDRKRASKRQQQDEEREEGELSTEEVMEGKDSDEFSEEEEEPVVVSAKPKDLRQLLNRDADTNSVREDRGRDKTAMRRRLHDDEGSEEEMDLDAELEHLMEQPVKKRMMMRMHADDEEEKIKAKRSHSGLGLLTVVASDREKRVHSRLTGRLGNRLGQRTGGAQPRKRVSTNEARVLNSEDDDEEEDADEVDDFAKELESYRSIRNLPQVKTSTRSASSALNSTESSFSAKSSLGGGNSDLRSRLGGQKHKADSDRRNFPAMRIEVLDEDDDDDDDE